MRGPNYDDGTVSILPVAASGMLGTAVSLSPCMNPHEVVFDASNKLAYIPCLGSDEIAIYNFDATTGAMTPKTTVATPAGSGPRHLVFSADEKRAWLIASSRRR